MIYAIRWIGKNGLRYNKVFLDPVQADDCANRLKHRLGYVPPVLAYDCFKSMRDADLNANGKDV